jgi:hypothetical protein
MGRRNHERRGGSVAVPLYIGFHRCSNRRNGATNPYSTSGGRACDVCAMARSSQQLQGHDPSGPGPISGPISYQVKRRVCTQQAGPQVLTSGATPPPPLPPTTTTSHTNTNANIIHNRYAIGRDRETRAKQPTTRAARAPGETPGHISGSPRGQGTVQCRPAHQIVLSSFKDAEVESYACGGLIDTKTRG